VKTRLIVTSVLFALGFLGLTSVPAYAQQEKGDKEIQFQGFFFRTVGVPDGNATLGAVFFNSGYFLTAKHEVGGGTSITFAGVGGSTSVMAGLNAFYRYNLKSKGAKAFPYLGGDFFVEDVKHAGDTHYLRPNLGFKYFFKKNAAFDVNMGYGLNLKDTSVGLIDARFGLSFIF
jgi:hypothetical protein